MSGDAAAPAIAPIDVLAFWRAAGPDKWYAKDDAFDAEIAARFGALWRAAANDELASWETTPEGALALVIVLDQFPRNMFRGQARTYDTDAVARAVADRALERGFDREVEVTQYAELHADIIRRFGRFPHRNAMLGRDMTPEEQAFLDAGGFAG
jgi:uncharacterized protein (DUF924 family)